MDISKKDLLEMNIVDIHDKMVERFDPRSCRLLYDFIEGNLNKDNINEWARLQVNLIVNLKVLLKVANKNNIEKTVTAKKKLQISYRMNMGIYPICVNI